MKVYGLLGEKLSHSLSPAIHQSLFQKTEIAATYGLFEVDKEQIKNAVNAMKSLGICGLNVTIPYKESVMEQMDELSTEARKIGAVNTIYYDGQKVIGHNTDYAGFGKLLAYGDVAIQGNTFYVLGAGGAAKSIVWYLKDHGATVILVSRDQEAAAKKFEQEKVEVVGYDALASVSDAYGIVNTTPCGMYPNVETTPVPKEVLGSFQVAIDIVYNPEETLFMKQAKESGLHIVGGLWMLVAQGIESERLWQQRDFDASYEEAIYQEIQQVFR